jgi:hypothetical protein
MCVPYLVLSLSNVRSLIGDVTFPCDLIIWFCHILIAFFNWCHIPMFSLLGAVAFECNFLGAVTFQRAFFNWCCHITMWFNYLVLSHSNVRFLIGDVTFPCVFLTWCCRIGLCFPWCCHILQFALSKSNAVTSDGAHAFQCAWDGDYVERFVLCYACSLAHKAVWLCRTFCAMLCLFTCT